MNLESDAVAKQSLRRRMAGLVVMLMLGFGAAAAQSQEWPIIELRQYTLRPGARDVLIDLFEAHFVESHEALGMKIVGTFRDLDRPDRFVWIRAFRDMPSRAEALNSLYSGPVWKAHGKAAAATMLDSANVLLLGVTRQQSGLALTGARPPPGATTEPRALIVVNVYLFERAVDSEFVELFERAAVPELEASGIPVLASYITHSAANNYPPLPIRTDNAFVWFTRFADRADYDSRMAALRSSARWNNVAESLRSRLKSAPEVLLLQPTPRSLLGASTVTRSDSSDTPEVPMEQREAEMALSAAPEHLRAGAGVYVLTSSGYKQTRQSANKFTCIVNRDHPEALKPTCFDEEGTATILPKILRVGQLMMQGKPLSAIDADIRSGFANGRFVSPRRPGIAYMLSGDIRNVNPATGAVASFPPHVMFYAPNLTNEDVGSNGTPGLPFIAYQGPHGYMIMPVQPDPGSPAAPEKTPSRCPARNERRVSD